MQLCVLFADISMETPACSGSLKVVVVDSALLWYVLLCVYCQAFKKKNKQTCVFFLTIHWVCIVSGKIIR